MAERHIVSSFDQDLEAVQAHLMRMGGLVEAAIKSSTDALVQRDRELALRVQRGDRRIDELEELVKGECARILALRAPTAVDLRIVLAVLSIAIHLERAGDHARGIATRAERLLPLTHIDEIANAIKVMANLVETLVADALDTFIQRDARAAEEIRLRDADVDLAYTMLFRSLLTHMMEDPRNITAGMHLHFIAKNLERIGDHATGIAEQVVYLVTGEMPQEDRPKADDTKLEQPEEH